MAGMTLRQFFMGKTDKNTYGPMPEFENVVGVVISTFAVFVGFTINTYLNKVEIEDWRHWRFYAFIALTTLLLRYIIGSAVHLNHVYVQKTGVGPAMRQRSRSAVLLFKDICFLVIFGVIAVHTSKAGSFNDFVTGTLWFVGAGFVWSVLDAIVRCTWACVQKDSLEGPGKFVVLWIILDVALFVIVLTVNHNMDHELTRAQVIAGLYFLFLFLDFLAIIRATQFS
jgi:hypothetical protein